MRFLMDADDRLHGNSSSTSMLVWIKQLIQYLPSHLPASRAAYLTGHSLFPALISRGLTIAFGFAAAMCVIAALASLLRGGKYVHRAPAAAVAPAADAPVAVAPAAVAPVADAVPGAADAVPGAPGIRAPAGRGVSR